MFHWLIFSQVLEVQILLPVYLEILHLQQGFLDHQHQLLRLQELQECLGHPLPTLLELKQSQPSVLEGPNQQACLGKDRPSLLKLALSLDNHKLQALVALFLDHLALVQAQLLLGLLVLLAPLSNSTHLQGLTLW